MGLINLPLQSVLFLMKFYGALSSRRHGAGESGGEGRVAAAWMAGEGCWGGDDIRYISMGKQRQHAY